MILRRNEWNVSRALRASTSLTAKFAGKVSGHLLEVQRWFALPRGSGAVLQTRSVEQGGEPLIKKVRALLQRTEFSIRAGNYGPSSLEACSPTVRGEEPPASEAEAGSLHSPRRPRVRLSVPERRDVESLTRRLECLRRLFPDVGRNIQLSEQVLGWAGDRPSGLGSPQPQQEGGAVPLLGY